MDKKKDDLYFNCSEPHEVDFVVKQYMEPDKVREYIKQKCKDGTIKRSTHQQVYDLLASQGFKKK